MIFGEEKSALRIVTEAISKWCTENKKGISCVVLPKKLYKKFRKEARSTRLGRKFLKNGLQIWQAPVFKYSGNKIVIN